MGTLINISGITGQDGVAPVYNPDSRWTTWALSEVYLGTVGQGKYVPKVLDHVRDTESNLLYQVKALDPSTLKPTLVRVIESNVGEFGPNDLLLGVGPGTQSDTYRVYLDKSVIPFVLAVDARLFIGGSTASYAKLFVGSDLTGNSKVISAVFDQSGNLIGQAVPLETVVRADGRNVAIKTVPVCYTTENLVDGEIVTISFFTDDGHVVSKRQLLVENTAFIRAIDVGTKYVTAISLKTPFLSKSNPELIEYPLNIPLNGLNLIGQTHYSDGSVLEMPVDGTKFSVFGITGFLSTVVGQELDVVLRYTLSPDEVSYGNTVVTDHFITRNYKVRSLNEDGAYTVKLFGYPVWIDDINGYRLAWYMYDLNRQQVNEVTPYVKLESNSATFNPTNYGTLQHLIVSINLRDVNGSFKDYKHTQTYDLALRAPGSDRGKTNWTIAFDPGQTPPYGIGNFAATTFINQNLWKVRLASDATTQEEWLRRFYYDTRPLVDRNVDFAAPVPTHFEYDFNGTSVSERYAISEWNKEQTINRLVPNNSTLFIRFIKETPTNDLQLSIAGIPVYQQN